MHHGDVEIKHPMEGAVSEMVAWANSNPAPQDLVVLYIWDCDGGTEESHAYIKIKKYTGASVLVC